MIAVGEYPWGSGSGLTQELFDPKEEVAELSQPRRESAASQPRSFYPEAPELYQRGGIWGVQPASARFVCQRV